MKSVVYTPLRKPGKQRSPASSQLFSRKNEQALIYDDKAPPEKRLLIRQHYRYYSYVVVGAVYDVAIAASGLNAAQLAQPDTYIPALTQCVRKHVYLSTVIRHSGTKKETFARANEIDLRQHIYVISQDDITFSTTCGPLQQRESGSGPQEQNEDYVIARAFEFISNDSKVGFFDTQETIPAWRLVVLPLPSSDSHHRVMLSYAYAHSHGDGMSGLLFHRTFSPAFAETVTRTVRNTADDNAEKTTTHIVMAPTLDLSASLNPSVGLSYVLAPALGQYLPSFISQLLGYKASVSGADETTWTGTLASIPTDLAASSVPTAVEILSVSNDVVSNVLQECRKHRARLTALLNELIALCLSRHLPEYTKLDPDLKNLVSVTATNIRKAYGISDDTMGNFGSGSYAQHSLRKATAQLGQVVSTTSTMISSTNATDDDVTRTPQHAIDEDFWSKTARETLHLASRSSSQHNQPIGLLRFIGNFHAWITGQIGAPRDGSWEVSNLGNFVSPLVHNQSQPAASLLSAVASTADGNINNINDINTSSSGSSSSTDPKQTKTKTKTKTKPDQAPIKISQVFFNQPANAVNPPLTFSIVSLQSGNLNICLSWQVGALEPELVHNPSISKNNNNDKNNERRTENKERQFATALLTSLHEYFSIIAAAGAGDSTASNK